MGVMSRASRDFLRMGRSHRVVAPAPAREVRVRLGVLVRDVGGCNGCTERVATEVTEVHLRGLQFRVCNTCRDAMLRQMLEAYK